MIASVVFNIAAVIGLPFAMFACFTQQQGNWRRWFFWCAVFFVVNVIIVTREYVFER